MVRDHTELDVYKLFAELADRVHAITSRTTFTDENLRQQLNEAVDSSCPNLGEGFSRYYPRDNARFVRVAKGSATEVIEHLLKVRKRGYAPPEECDEISLLARRARGASTGYLLYLESTLWPKPPSDRQKRRDVDRDRRPSTTLGSKREREKKMKGGEEPGS